MALAIIAAPSTIYVEPGPHSRALAVQLERELPPGTVVSRYAADLWITLETSGKRLIVEARSRDGDLILRRDIPIEDDVAPALRVATVLISEAARRDLHVASSTIAAANLITTSDLAPTTTAALAFASSLAITSSTANTRPNAKTKYLRSGMSAAVNLGVPSIPRSILTTAAPVKPSSPPLDGYAVPSLFGVWWKSPATTPQLGFGLTMMIGHGNWRAGIGAMIAGLCCLRASSGAEATALEIGILATGAFTIFRFEGGALSLTASFGIDFVQLDAKASGLAGPGTAISKSALEAVIIAAPSLQLPLWSGAGLEIRAGGRIVPNPLVITTPSVPGRPSLEGLHAGFVTPFVEASLPLELF